MISSGSSIGLLIPLLVSPNDSSSMIFCPLHQGHVTRIFSFPIRLFNEAIIRQKPSFQSVGRGTWPPRLIPFLAIIILEYGPNSQSASICFIWYRAFKSGLSNLWLLIGGIGSNHSSLKKCSKTAYACLPTYPLVFGKTSPERIGLF